MLTSLDCLHAYSSAYGFNFLGQVSFLIEPFGNFSMAIGLFS